MQKKHTVNQQLIKINAGFKKKKFKKNLGLRLITPLDILEVNASKHFSFVTVW